ncbi:hypothetical protein GCM10009619_29360 [Williamsia maris]
MTDRQGPREALVFAARPVVEGGRHQRVVADVVRRTLRDRGGDADVGVEREMGSVLFDRPERYDQSAPAFVQLGPRLRTEPTGAGHSDNGRHPGRI